MKHNLILAALLLVLMLALPVIALGLRGGAPPEDPAAVIVTPRGRQVPQKSAASPPAAADAHKLPESVPVMRGATGKIETVGLEEYLRGCVAAEMPLGYHVEALKAQAVACGAYAAYRLAQGRDSVSDSPDTDQAYLSPGERAQKWGANAGVYEKKLGEAVAAVLGRQVTYKGQPILAAYHANGSGLTESAEEYWGGDYPYLAGVSSPGDRLSPDYAKTTFFTPAQIKAALKDEEGVSLGGDPAAWFGKAESTDAGTVRSIPAGGKALSGQKLRALLGLRSANFTITYKEGGEGGFAVKTIGCGHGVGMSQYGADFMARQGSDYKEILEHYYIGCEIA